MDDQLFFVGIRNPISVRKELLLSCKGLLDSLRRQEKYKLMKEEKLQSILELKRTFDELLLLNKKLRNKLPKIPNTSETPVRSAPEQRRVVEPRGKLDLLEEELAKVERRLSSLE